MNTKAEKINNYLFQNKEYHDATMLLFNHLEKDLFKVFCYVCYKYILNYCSILLACMYVCVPCLCSASGRQRGHQIPWSYLYG